MNAFIAESNDKLQIVSVGGHNIVAFFFRHFSRKFATFTVHDVVASDK